MIEEVGVTFGQNDVRSFGTVKEILIAVSGILYSDSVSGRRSFPRIKQERRVSIVISTTTIDDATTIVSTKCS